MSVAGVSFCVLVISQKRSQVNLDSSWSALGNTVALAKESDPLAPVTVVTSGASMSRDVVNWLARSHHFSEGVVNVRVAPASQLIRLVADFTNAANDRDEATLIQREAACRKVLDENPGIFGELALSRHTVRALARSSVVLDGVRLPDSVRGLSALTDDVMRVHQELRAILGQNFLTLDELVDDAKEALTHDHRVQAHLGSVVVFLPVTDRGGLEASFVEWLMGQENVHTIDWPVAEFSTSDMEQMLRRAEVVTASNPDDEARAIARLVVDEISGGTPGHRIGVFFWAR